MKSSGSATVAAGPTARAPVSSMAITRSKAMKGSSSTTRMRRPFSKLSGSDAAGSEEEAKSGRQPVEESAEFNPDHAEAFVAWFAVDCRSSAIHPVSHHNSPSLFQAIETRPPDSDKASYLAALVPSS